MDQSHQLYFKQAMKKTQSNHKLNNQLKNTHHKIYSKIIQGHYQITSQKNNQPQNNHINQTKKYQQSKINLQTSNKQDIDIKKKHSLSPQQHRKFITQVSKQRKNLSLKRMHRLKQQQKEKEKKRQQEEMEKKNQEMQKKLQKQNQLKFKLQQQQIHKKQLQQKQKIYNSQLLKILNNKPRYQKLQQAYSQLQVSTLEQKKKKLAQIRQLHKPIGKAEIQEHQQKVKQLKQRYESEHQNKTRFQNDKLNVYRSHWYNTIKNQVNNQTQVQIQKERLKQDTNQKVRNYTQYVRTNFKPEIDIKKTQELKIKNNTTIPHQVTGNQSRALGKQYLKNLKQILPTLPKHPKIQSESKENLRPVYHNYLKQIPSVTKHQGKACEQLIIQNLSNLISNPQKIQKKSNQILQHAQKLQSKAFQKYKMNKVNKEDSIESDQMFLKAIQAKLTLLNSN